MARDSTMVTQTGLRDNGHMTRHLIRTIPLFSHSSPLSAQLRNCRMYEAKDSELQMRSHSLDSGLTGLATEPLIISAASSGFCLEGKSPKLDFVGTRDTQQRHATSAHILCSSESIIITDKDLDVPFATASRIALLSTKSSIRRPLHRDPYSWKKTNIGKSSNSAISCDLPRLFQWFTRESGTITSQAILVSVTGSTTTKPAPAGQLLLGS